VTILAIDPGVTTGIAIADEYSIHPYVALNPNDIARTLDRYVGSTDTVLIENFVGGGYRTPEAIVTLKILGFAEYHARHNRGALTILRAPQLRKPYVQTAKSLFGPDESRHAADALAHIISYVKEYPDSESDPHLTRLRRLFQLSAE